MASVREVDYGDLEGVGELNRSAGWHTPTRGNWQRLWDRNPARAGGPPLSKGWVLEEGGKLVGCLINLAHLYDFGGRTLRAAVAGSLVVAPDFRGNSLQLVMAFVKQSGVDLLLNTTTAPQVSKIFQFLKLQPLPQPEYGRSLYWVLRGAGFLNAGLRKKGYSRALSLRRQRGPRAGLVGGVRRAPSASPPRARAIRSSSHRPGEDRRRIR